MRSEEHTSELQSLRHLVCRLLRRTTVTPFPYTTLFRSAIDIVFLVPAFALTSAKTDGTARPTAPARPRPTRAKPNIVVVPDGLVNGRFVATSVAVRA